MDFWDQTIETTKNFLSAAEKKTDEFIAVQKLNIKISSLQSKLSAKYKELGISVYNMLQEEQALEADAFALVAEEISALKKELQELNDQKVEVKGKKVCPECGKNVDAKSAFCSKCGAQL